MATHLIHPEAIRCCNHRCTLRTNCKRYMQLMHDKVEKRDGIKVTRYGDVDITVSCHYHEPINLEKR